MAEGIIPRQTEPCLREHGRNGCRCERAQQAWVWDQRAGRKIYRTFSGKQVGEDGQPITALEAAKRWRDKEKVVLRTQAKRAPVAPVGMPTIREAAEAWLELCESGQARSRNREPFKPSTLRGYRRAFEDHIYDDFGAVALDGLDERGGDVQRLIDRLNAKGLSGQTTRNIVVALQSFFRHHRREIANPCRDLDLPAPGGRRTHAITARQAAELIGALPEEDRALWATALFAGLRLGELRALRVCDVELEREVDDDDGTMLPAPTITVSRGWDVKQGAIEPKSRAGNRDLPIPATLAELLRAHVARTGRRGEDLIFARASSSSAPFTDSYMRKRASDAWDAEDAKRAERELEPLERTGFHEARHAWRSYVDNVPEISETRADAYAGHASSTMRGRYAHAFQVSRARDGLALEAYLSGRASGKVIELAEAAAR